VGPATDNYQLSISGFTGITPTDPFSTRDINGQQFTTYNKDNDQWSGGNCALNSNEHGGWWHKNCNYINLNYNYKFSGKGRGFMRLSSKWYDPKFVEMKLRPLKCQI